MNNIEFVGAHPVGDKAWHTPRNPSPTGVGSYGWPGVRNVNRTRARTVIQPFCVWQELRMPNLHVGAHPVGDRAWHTPRKPSPTGVASHSEKRSVLLETYWSVFKNLVSGPI